MSGPVSVVEASPTVGDCSHPSAACVGATDSRDEQVINPGHPYWHQEQGPR